MKTTEKLSSEICSSVTGRMVFAVSSDYGAIIFRVKQSKSFFKTSVSSNTSVRTSSTAR